MPVLWSLLAAVPCVLATPADPARPGPAAVAPRSAVARPDVLEEADRWMRRFKRGRVLIARGSEAEAELLALMSSLRTLRGEEPARAREVDTFLLDLAGVGLEQELEIGKRTAQRLEQEHAEVQSSTARARQIGELTLESILLSGDRGKQMHWIAADVLAMPRQNPGERRLAALGVLVRHRGQAGLMALLGVARDERDDLRVPAIEALVGWPSPLADNALLDLLERGPVDPELDGFGLVVDHLARRRRPLPDDTAARLGAWIAREVRSSDWRAVSRAVELSAELDALVAVPILLDALETWIARGEQDPGHGARRLRFEVLRELQRRSGRMIGASPEHWRSWWDAVRAGEAELAAAEGGDAEPLSRATFFGLRPESDQVWFVLDRSTSMSNLLGTSGSSLYEEAIGQLLRYVESSGRGTRFGITLFSDETRVWRRKPTWATERELDAARRWLEANGPAGSTELLPALEETLHLRPDGSVDLAALEVDTVIVLCDGETAQGPDWVEPLLERVLEPTRIVFHCVLIGSRGDGTLEALAEGSGGTFLRWR